MIGFRSDAVGAEGAAEERGGDAALGGEGQGEWGVVRREEREWEWEWE